MPPSSVWHSGAKLLFPLLKLPPLADSCVATDVVAAAPAMMFAGEFGLSVLTSRMTENAKQQKKGNKEKWEVYGDLVNEVGGKQRW